MPSDVAAAFDLFPRAVRSRLMVVRRLIFETAALAEGVGPPTETLKWGEPAYLTAKSRSGSTIRLGWKPAQPNSGKVFFICNTGLVDDFRALFSDELTFEGNRAIIVDGSGLPPVGPLQTCIAMALTYHLRKKRG